MDYGKKIRGRGKRKGTHATQEEQKGLLSAERDAEEGEDDDGEDYGLTFYGRMSQELDRAIEKAIENDEPIIIHIWNDGDVKYEIGEKDWNWKNSSSESEEIVNELSRRMTNAGYDRDDNAYEHNDDRKSIVFSKPRRRTPRRRRRRRRRRARRRRLA